MPRQINRQRPGIDVPGDGAHVQLTMPGGFSLELDTAEPARLWHSCWRADPARATVVLGFVLRPGRPSTTATPG